MPSRSKIIRATNKGHAISAGIPREPGIDSIKYKDTSVLLSAHAYAVRFTV